MEPILCGIETEYGLSVEGRGAEDQIDDAKAVVRSYPDDCLPVWDYRFESPRADLRGFQLDRLAYDPADAEFDRGRSYGPDSDVRSDRILPNGARLYNDHGHPEYATPECWDAFQCALHDKAGETAVLIAARACEARTGLRTRIYKNNTDFHGASYGTHESYLVPRSLGWEALYRAVTPILVARQVLTGAGKVGSESGGACAYQLSQRADFFVEPLNAETLFRRPVFNTRDEPHADPAKWIRLHVISGDANMLTKATARKVALVKLAIQLAIVGAAPNMMPENPVDAFKKVSRDESLRFEIELEGRAHATAYEVLERYFGAAEAQGWLKTAEFVEAKAQSDPYLLPFTELFVVHECRDLLGMIGSEELRKHVDWAAKRYAVEEYMREYGVNWRDPVLQSVDLEYSNLEQSEGLFFALQTMGEVDEPVLPEELLSALLNSNWTRTRSELRSAILQQYRDNVVTMSWGSVTIRTGKGDEIIELSPDFMAGPELPVGTDVESLVEYLRGINDHSNR